MGVLTALLHSLGLSWLASFAICAALSPGVTGFAAWRVSVFFDHAGMHATRRQLARFGVGEENGDDEAGDKTAPAPQAGARGNSRRTPEPADAAASGCAAARRTPARRPARGRLGDRVVGLGGGRGGRLSSKKK